MEEFYFILELIVGITGITLGILLFTSRLIIDSRSKVYNRSVTIMSAGYMALGLGTLVLLYFCPTYDMEAKNLFIQCMLPIEAFFFAAAMFSPLMETGRFRHFLSWQGAAWGTVLLAVLSAGYIIDRQMFHPGMLFWVEIPPLAFLLSYTAYYFMKVYREWKRMHPEVLKLQHTLFLTAWVLLNLICVLAVACSIFSNVSESHAVFTLLYIVILYVVAIFYYRFLLLGILPATELCGEEEPQPEVPVASAVIHESSAAVLPQHEPDWEAIAEKVEAWTATDGKLRNGLTIIDLSKEIGVNRTYLSHYINSRYACNFNQWLNRLRIEVAQERILQNPEISLMELAEQVGYSDMAHFSKQFKQVAGIPPSVWKKNKVG